MKAGEIMHQRVLATTPRASVRDVATKLVMNRISGMPVTDREGRVLGVITEEDILRALMERKSLETLTAQDVMSKHLATVGTDTSIEEVMEILHDEGILRVPVTDRGKVVGIVSRADVIRAALDLEFMTFSRNLAPVSGKNRASEKRRNEKRRQKVASA